MKDLLVKSDPKFKVKLVSIDLDFFSLAAFSCKWANIEQVRVWFNIGGALSNIIMNQDWDKGVDGIC